MRISDWSSDVCSSYLASLRRGGTATILGMMPLSEKVGLSAMDLLSGKKLQGLRSEEHTSELQTLMRISYAVFCLKNKISEWPPITLQTDNHREGLHSNTNYKKSPNIDHVRYQIH